jgi:hypothetical protein
MLSKNLYTIITNNSPKFIEESDDIEIDEKSNDLTYLKQLNIDCESIHGGKVRIPTIQSAILIFWDTKDLRTRITADCLEKEILVIYDETKQSLSFNPVDRSSYQNFTINTKDYLLENAYYYFKTLEHLKANEHKEDHLFYFVDHFNSSFRKIVFTSLNKEGKLTISYPLGIPQLSRQDSYKERCEAFFAAFSKDNKHFPKFIKNEMFKVLIKEKLDDRIVTLFEKLNEILITAEQNFELYLNDLSLEKFRTDYIESKEKYFSQLRDILGKITSQVIALPLSITAAAFATYKTADKPILFILVLISFLLFSIYSFFLIRLYKFDVIDLDLSFKRDFKKLSEEEYFIKFPNEMVNFSRIQTSINNRVRNLKNLIFAYTLLLAITNSLFVLFSCLQKGLPEGRSYLIAISSLGILVLFVNFLIWKIKSDE